MPSQALLRMAFSETGHARLLFGAAEHLSEERALFSFLTFTQAASVAKRKNVSRWQQSLSFNKSFNFE